MNKSELFYNGKIITVDAAESITEAFVVEGEKIIETGQSKALLARHRNAVRHDLRGKTVIPGLNDSHAHPLNSSLSEADEDIPVVKSVKEVLTWVRRQAILKPKGSWLYIHRIYPVRLRELRLPTLAELDAAAPDHPVFLNGAFSGMVNTCALKMHKISGDNRHEGVVLDPKTGTPTGVLHRSAYSLIGHEEEGRKPRAKRIALAKKMLAEYNSMGITSITETVWEKEEWPLLNAMAEDEALSVRIHVNYMPAMPKTRQETLDLISHVNFRTGSGDEWLKMGPFKTFVDGGLLTGTAFMLEPWGRKAGELFGTAEGYRGNCNYTLEQLTDVVMVAAENGFNFICHATGSGAVDLVLRAYEAVNEKIPLKGKRFQLLHGNFFSPEVLDKCAAMGIVLDLQPAWFYKDVEALTALLGKKRMAHFHPYRDMLKKGLLICSGSDHMAKFDPQDSINPYNPFFGLYALSARTTEKGTLFKPEQALTRMVWK